MKKLAILLLTLFFLRPIPAQAASITFQSKEAGFSFAPGSVYSPTDLFENFKSILPGDRLEDTVLLENTSNVPLKLTFQALGGEKDTDFLSALHLQVSSGSRVLFDDSPDKISGTVSLGTLLPGKSMELKLRMDVPLSLDNDFQSVRGDVLWLFRAEEIEDTLIQTGQPLDAILWCGLLGCSALMAGMILWRKKGG